MSRKRLTMRQIKEVLRQYYELHLNGAAISQSTGIPRSTIRDYLRRFKASNLIWPLPSDVDNDKLNELLFPVKKASKKELLAPNWEAVHRELKRKGVTLQILWEEYKREHSAGYQYSWFAHLYRQWAKTRDVWMPQAHKAGDKLFVDYSGLTVPIWTTNLQAIQFQAEIFVGVLGASDLIFCAASENQQLENWVEAHCQMFHYYGGVTALIVPDNLRSGVNKAHRYEPLCNLTYEEMARHYNCAIMPARGYQPRDKAKVEKAVQSVQQRVLAPMRDTQHTSLEALNQEISTHLEALNNRNFQKFPYSRRELFNKIEKSELKPLPFSRYVLARWFQETVNGGYHISIYQHYYSVPFQYARKKVDIRVSAKTVECFYKEKLIACHARHDAAGTYTTVDAHRPEAHRQQALWRQEKLQQWAEGIGPYTCQLIFQLFSDEKRHLHQKERSALGILRLSNKFNEDQLENVCKKALEIGTVKYNSILSLLKRGKHKTTSGMMEPEKLYETPDHENIRGAKYYH